MSCNKQTRCRQSKEPQFHGAVWTYHNSTVGTLANEFEAIIGVDDIGAGEGQLGNMKITEEQHGGRSCVGWRLTSSRIGRWASMNLPGEPRG